MNSLKQFEVQQMENDHSWLLINIGYINNMNNMAGVVGER